LFPNFQLTLLSNLSVFTWVAEQALDRPDASGTDFELPGKTAFEA
jgi:hypothetical protein